MAIEQGDLQQGINLDVATDMLYGPIYYRLLINSGKIDAAFIETLYQQFITAIPADPQEESPAVIVASDAGLHYLPKTKRQCSTIRVVTSLTRGFLCVSRYS